MAEATVKSFSIRKVKYLSLACIMIIHLPKSASPGRIGSHTLSDGAFGNQNVIPMLTTFSLAKDLQAGHEGWLVSGGGDVRANQRLSPVQGGDAASRGFMLPSSLKTGISLK